MADTAASSRNLDFMCGVWKRTLTRRSLATFAVATGAAAGGSGENQTLVVIDRTPEELPGGDGAVVAPSSSRKRGTAAAVRYRWSFGRNLETARLGFTVDALPPSSREAVDALPLRVQYGSRDCYGMYQPDVGVLTMHLHAQAHAHTPMLAHSAAHTAVVVYRIIDDDTCAVTITDIPALAPGSAKASLGDVEYGYMFRVRT